MVLSLADAVAIFNKWKEDSAEILVVVESPFQQSRRGILEQGIDWALGLQGHVSEASIDATKKGKKAGAVVLQAPTGNLSLSLVFALLYTKNHGKRSQLCEQKLRIRQVSALSVFFPSNEVFVFYELREPLGKTSLPAWSTI